MKEALSVEDTLKLALEALTYIYTETTADEDELIDQAITAIKKALAQTQEPVAWGVFDDNLHDMFFAKEEAQEMVRLKGDGSTVKPLYTTPPQREFVGLTDEERQDISLEVPIDAVLITEAKLRSKNNG